MTKQRFRLKIEILTTFDREAPEKVVEILQDYAKGNTAMHPLPTDGRIIDCHIDGELSILAEIVDRINNAIDSRCFGDLHARAITPPPELSPIRLPDRDTKSEAKIQEEKA